MAIEKTTSLTTATGILSNYSYSLSHSFLYKMAINPGDIDWEGGSAEPKEILFNEDKIYLHSLKEKELNIPTNDSITENMFANYELEIVHYYEQHIDKRYFFKLLGDDFWTEITTEEYSEAKKSGQEYAIPNDNELTVPSTIFDILKK